MAGVRLVADGGAQTEVRRFDTTVPGLLALSGWLAEQGCTHVAMEARDLLEAGLTHPVGRQLHPDPGQCSAREERVRPQHRRGRCDLAG